MFFNLDAPKSSIAYKIATENKQLGWYFYNWDDIPPLDILIFNTKKELEKKKYSSYYWDWDLELSCLCAYISDTDKLLVSNIPFIIKNHTFYSKFLPSLKLEIFYNDYESFLNLKEYKEGVLIKNNKGNIINFPDLDFYWYLRYEYFYLKKYQKTFITKFLNEFPYYYISYLKNLDQAIKLLFNKSNWKLFKLLVSIREEHNLLFFFEKDLNETLSLGKQILNLEKKYGIQIYSLLNKIQKIPTENEIKEWLLKNQVDFIKDLKESLFKNKKIKLEYGWEIYELTSAKDLKEEAEYQHNCLEGYNSSLLNPITRFFSARKKDYRFSMLFYGDKLAEIKGRFNKNISTYPKNIQEEIDYILLILKDYLAKEINN